MEAQLVVVDVTIVESLPVWIRIIWYPFFLFFGKNTLEGPD